MQRFDPQTYYVQEIGIYPDAQHHGYGTLMMDVARQTALAYDCKLMALDVGTSNTNAIHAWEKFGFKPIHTSPVYHRMILPLVLD